MCPVIVTKLKKPREDLKPFTYESIKSFIKNLVGAGNVVLFEFKNNPDDLLLRDAVGEYN